MNKINTRQLLNKASQETALSARYLKNSYLADWKEQPHIKPEKKGCQFLYANNDLKDFVKFIKVRQR